MNDSKLLLNAYYEALYERLESNRERLIEIVEKLLRCEIAERGYENFDEEKFTAYFDTCLAFIDERMESYNPVGFQYIFDRVRSREVLELELQLNWYDSQAEFESLMQAVRSKVETKAEDEDLQEVAEELIKDVGAFPDNSIISAYEAKPALGKLPDYIVSLAIEQIVR